MKKTYLAPHSTCVDLYAEEALLSVSGEYEVDADQETENRWSQQRDYAWDSSQWQ